ncbi:MAG: tRNA glutamyl-Q(34) synthetase GluQRS [Gammaproteobacteria bacterium]|nr:tRNA glutamyl-Q(34) synthetase GluQRS [Gammaproteobacteria bacterium]
MPAPETPTYVGRFAPSPTGPLHFGSLLAAIASYLQARAHNGRWLLRIEDIDPPREQQGADRLIVATLEAYGFEWDGPVTYQSNNERRHREVLDELLKRGVAYPCACSRRDLAGAPTGPLGAIYPGTCRSGCNAEETAVRVLTHDRRITFHDGLQGHYGQRLESESGDFVIWRRDGLVAYHLAVVVDDHDQGVTEIVRGIDLLDSTPRQIHLQQLCGFATPRYVHIPVATNPDGQKLSKLTGAAAIDAQHPAETLVSALRVLRQKPPGNLASASLQEIWRWATGHWTLTPLAGRKTVQGGQDSMLQRENRLR